MAEATSLERAVRSDDSSSPTPISRNNDVLSTALRQSGELDLDAIVEINRAILVPRDAFASSETTSPPRTTSYHASNSTKPTSTDMTYVMDSTRYNGKGKARASYASSLSVAHGSGSEAEQETKERQRQMRREALLSMGGWTAACDGGTSSLVGTGRAKTRTSKRPSKTKKPIVEIHQYKDRDDSEWVASGMMDYVSTTVPKTDRTETKYLRKRSTIPQESRNLSHEEHHLRLAEEGQFHPVPAPSSLTKPMTAVRVYALIGIVLLLFVTLIAASVGASYTGKERLGSTKLIVFGATVIVAVLTVFAMIVARRSVHEALLTGLMEIVIGFYFIEKLDDFL